MARKHFKPKKKLQPAVLNITTQLPAHSGSGTTHKFVDLSQLASIVNRRFYRQGLAWYVGGFTMITTGIGNMTVSSVPNSWVTGGAWEKTFRHWKKQQDEAVEAAGAQSSVAKFRDFKVHMTVDHMTAGFANNQVPIDSETNSADLGEWEASKIVVPNILPDGTGSNIEPTEYFLHMCGVNNNAGVSRGVIDGYGASRAYPHSPDPVGPDMASSNNYLQQMTDVGNDTPEILDRATDINDVIPSHTK